MAILKSSNSFPLWSDGTNPASVDSEGFFYLPDTFEAFSFGQIGLRTPRITGGGATVLYFMRAFDTVGGTHVYWTSKDAPDETGAGAPVPPGNLTDIVVLGISTKQ